jgi:hypothetical protein
MADIDNSSPGLLSVDEAQGMLKPSVEPTKKEVPSKLISVDEAQSVLKPKEDKKSKADQGLISIDEAQSVLTPKQETSQAQAQIPSPEQRVATEDPMNLSEGTKFILKNEADGKTLSKFLEVNPGMDVHLSPEQHRAVFNYHRSPEAPSTWEETKEGVKGMAEMGGKFLNTATEDILKGIGFTAKDWDKTGSGKAEDKAHFVSNLDQYGQNLGDVRKDVITGLDELVSGVKNAWNWGSLHGQGGFSWWDKNGENSGYTDDKGVYHPWRTEDQSFHNHMIRTRILGEQARRSRVTPSGFGEISTAINTQAVPTPEENQANNPGMTYEQAQDKTWKDAATLTKQAAQASPILQEAIEAGKPEVRFGTGFLYAGANPYGLAATGVNMLGKGIAGGERFLANVGRNAEEISRANQLRANAIKASQEAYKAARGESAGYVPIAQIPEQVPFVGGKTISLPTLGTTAGGIEKAAQWAQGSKFTIPALSAITGGALDQEHRGQGALEGLTLGLLGKKFGFKTIEEGAGLVRSAADAAKLLSGALPSEIMKEMGTAETASKGAQKMFGGSGLPTAIARDGADWIASNAVPFALKGVHGATLATAMGILNDTPTEKLPAEVIQGTLMTLVPGLLHEGLMESPNEIRARANRENQQIDSTMAGLSPEAKQTVEAVDYTTHEDRMRKLDAEAQQQMQETQQKAAEVAADPNASPEEKAKWQTIANEAVKARDRQKKALNQALTASPETRLEFNRQFKLGLAHINRMLNGALRAGQNNVGIEILTTQQAADKIIKNTPMLAALDAKGGIFQEEARNVASQIAKQAGATITPGEGGQLDPSKTTIFINADRLADNPLGIFTALFHEAGHAMNKIPEFSEANDDARKILFTTTRKDLNGNIESVNRGLYEDKDLLKSFFEKYMKNNSPNEILDLAGAAGLLSDQDPTKLDPQKVVEYMKEEFLADTNAGTLAKTFTEGRPTFEHLRKWAGLNTKANIAKRAIQKVLGLGGEEPKSNWYEPITGVQMTKELRQANEAAAQALHDLNGAINGAGEDPIDPVTGKPAKKEAKLTKTEIGSNKALLDHYAKDTGLVKTQMRAIVTDAQGNPVSQPIDIKNPLAAEGSWEVTPEGTIKQTRGYGQVPDELKAIQLPPGGQIHVQNQVLMEPDGVTPQWNTSKEIKKLRKNRAQLIRDAVTNAYKGEPNAVQAYSADNLSMRGTLTPDQVAAIKALPETIVPLKLKQYIFRVNDAIQSGRRQLTEYSTHIGKNGEYTSNAPVIRDNQYIGLHFSKDGNFTGTAVSWDALHRKMRLWSQRLPGRFDLWGGDTQKFYNEFMDKYLPNLNNDMSNDVNLDLDPAISKAKKNVFRDFVGFNNQANAGTYPDRTTIPTKRGEKRGEADNIVRSFRLDAIMDMIDHPAPLVKVPYEKVLKNLMPSQEPGISFKPRQEDEIPVEPFYSQLRNTLQAKVPNRTSAAQLLGIMSSGGVKKDEIHFSGIEQMIPQWKEQYGDRIPKEVIDQYLREDGAVRFKDVMLGGKAVYNENSEFLKKFPEIRSIYENSNNSNDFRLQLQNSSTLYDKLRKEGYGDLADDPAFAYKISKDIFVGNEPKPTKYDRPDLVVPGGENYREIVMTLPNADQIRAEQLHRESEGQMLNYEQRQELQNLSQKGNKFTSSHFQDIPNYVAHMRLDDRPDAEGNPGVFIQEMQNDRAKDARLDGGYAKGITKAPFSDPNKYTVALFKRALADAISRGKKWVGWTSGETQVDRYNLAKKVDEIKWEPYTYTGAKNPVKVISIIKDGSQLAGMRVNKDGEVSSGNTQFDGKQLSEIIPKEMADKIINGDDNGSLKGDGLSIGGDWTKNLYDKTAVSSIGDYVKKLGGGKVEKDTLDITKKMEDLDMGDESDATPEELELLKSGKGVSQSTPYWKVEITPEMERVVRQSGQPNFMPSRSKEGYDEEKFKGSLARAFEVLKKPENMPSVAQSAQEKRIMALEDELTKARKTANDLERIARQTAPDGTVRNSTPELAAAYRAAYQKQQDAEFALKQVKALPVSEEKITSAIYKNPRTGEVTEGLTHKDANPNAPEDPYDRHGEQYMFGTLEGRQLDRRDAFKVANAADQLIVPTDPEMKKLYDIGVLHSNMINYGNETATTTEGEQIKPEILDQYDGINFMPSKQKDEGFVRELNLIFPRGPKTLTYFSGGGLMEAGLTGLIDPRHAVEYDPQIAAAYAAAHGDHVTVGDVTQVDPAQFNGIEYFHASPVCKNYSALKAKTQGGVESDLDIRSAQVVAKVLEMHTPPTFTLENVKEYATGKDQKALDIIKATLDRLGYTFDEGIYNAHEYGAPTDRKRYLLRASIDGNLPEPVKVKGPSWYDVVHDIIDDLPDAPVKGKKDPEENYLISTLRADGIDPFNVPEPILFPGGGLRGVFDYRMANEPAFTFKATPANVDRILLPGGIFKRVTARAKARMSGLPDTFPLPLDPNLGIKIIGNGIPRDLVKNVFGPLFKDYKGPNFMPARDQSYMDAYSKGDTEAEREIIHARAREAGYQIFGWKAMIGDKPHLHTNDQYAVTFMAPYKEMAAIFAEEGKPIRAVATNASNIFDYRDYSQLKGLIKHLREYGVDRWNDEYHQVVEGGKGDQPSFKEQTMDGPIKFASEGNWSVLEMPSVRKWIAEQGHDGFYVREEFTLKDSEPNIAVFDPTKIKSIEPETTTLSGQVIPPSQRFDVTKANINFMPAKKGEQPTVDKEGFVFPKDPTKPFKFTKEMMVNFMPSQGVDLADHQDQPIIALPCDRMGVGDLYVGPTGAKQKLSVPGQGGPGFIHLQENGIWAFTNEDTAGRFMLRINQEAEKQGVDSILVAPTLQSPINHLKNPTGQKGYVEGMEAAVKAKILTKKDLDAQIKSISDAITKSTAASLSKPTKEKWASIQNWESFRNAVYTKQLNFQDTAPYLVQLERKRHPVTANELEKIGLLPTDIARDLADDRFFDLPFGSVVGLFEVKKGAKPFASEFHDSYGWQVPGRPIGFIKNIYNVDELTSDPRIRNKAGVVQTQPLQTVLPALDRVSEVLKDLTITPHIIKP